MQSTPLLQLVQELKKLIAKHYKLFQLDTGRLYRVIGKMKLENPKNFSYKLIKKKIKNLKSKELENKIVI